MVSGCALLEQYLPIEMDAVSKPSAIKMEFKTT
jgi:hypothetical protein